MLLIHLVICAPACSLYSLYVYTLVWQDKQVGIGNEFVIDIINFVFS